MFSEKITKNAPVIAISILLVVTVSVFLLDKPTSTKATEVATKATQATTSISSEPAANVAAAPPTTPASPPDSNTRSSNGVAPMIEGRLVEENAAEGEAQPTVTAAPMLADLLAGLEKKVAEDPTNMGSKMLLAQTYAEIGEVSRGLEVLREMLVNAPDNLKVRFVYASVLGKSDNPAELNEALELLNTLEQTDSTQKGSVFLQRGRIYLKMGETESAKKEWMQALTQLPEGSGYRKQVELELSRLN